LVREGKVNRIKVSPLVDEARKAARGYLAAVILFSLAVNLLYLSSPLYMMQVYNRVITSGSTVTLLLLTGMLIVALLALSGLDIVRGWIMSRLSTRLDQILSSSLLAAAFRTNGQSGGQALRDFETFRQFIASQAVFAIFDLPWVPIYLAVAFMLHAWFGFFALGCCALLIVLVLVSELRLVKPLREANEAMARSHSFVESSLRNAEVVQAMGMVDAVARRWQRDRSQQTGKQGFAATWSLSSTGVVRFFRLAMQSLILGLGAYLAIERQISTGAMFAATFLLGRALQPVEQIVSAWRQIVTARLAYLRVRDLLNETAAPKDYLTLPRPKGAVAAENVSYAPPGAPRPILRNASFQVQPAEAVGIVGPSGAGKSTLMRLLVGVVRPIGGVVRLDGADLYQWAPEQLGRAVGYLPQDVELFADTIAANISRFRQGNDAEVIRAAEMAGVHEMILKLPQGYNTQVGSSGEALSGGYRQRIGLARAVYDSPSLVALDEPSSNLDSEGDAALARCLAQLRQRGTTVFIVSHRPTTLASVDRIILMKDGVIEAFGPRDTVAQSLMPQRATLVRKEAKADG
jgi:ATP-binding cassette, subfamily C, bacterial